eukprot:TRINITY_DN2649_c0_g1_i2.p2 TRINITY_DN2649_c0_g1~~TRINITY_DN2649_c0_g1_i2.p2  ORF type:complete len:167 (+),score=39.94 TRINITY_DN2649_c0_g1_i2:76-501(+)
MAGAPKRPRQDALRAADARLGDKALGKDLRGEVSGFAGGFEDQLAAARTSTIKKRVTEFAEKFISGCRREALDGGASYKGEMEQRWFDDRSNLSKWARDSKELLLAELSKAGISEAEVSFKEKDVGYKFGITLTCKLVWAE